MSKLNLSKSVEQTEQNSWTAELFDEQDMVAYTCPDCGGRVLADKHTAATYCTYCHNPTVLASQLKGDYKPAKILPFTVPKEKVLDSLLALIKNKPLLPKFFKECVEKGEITGLYVPFWLFSSDIAFDTSGTAKNITMWSDSRYNYTKTDSFTYTRKGTLRLNLLPVDASSRLDNVLMDAIEPFNYNDLTDFSMEYLSGHFAETYDVDAAASYNRFANRGTQTTKFMVNNSLKQYELVAPATYNISFFKKDNIYAMLPVWTISVKHAGKVYSFAMNGQTGKSAGKLPISIYKALGFFFGIGSAISLLTMLFGYIRSIMQ